MFKVNAIFKKHLLGVNQNENQNQIYKDLLKSSDQFSNLIEDQDSDDSIYKEDVNDIQ